MVLVPAFAEQQGVLLGHDWLRWGAASEGDVSGSGSLISRGLGTTKKHGLVLYSWTGLNCFPYQRWLRNQGGWRKIENLMSCIHTFEKGVQTQTFDAGIRIYLVVLPTTLPVSFALHHHHYVRRTSPSTYCPSGILINCASSFLN